MKKRGLFCDCGYEQRKGSSLEMIEESNLTEGRLRPVGGVPDRREGFRPALLSRSERQ